MAKRNKPRPNQARNDKALGKPTSVSAEVAIERNLTTLESIDKVLTDRLGGDSSAYRDLLTDTTVTGTWTQRQTALTKMERQIVPYDANNAADVEAAKFVEAQLSRINFDHILKAMHWGVFYGLAVGEAMWDIEDGKVVLADVLVRDRSKFKFDIKQQLLYTGNGGDEVMPPRKFWTFSAGGDTTDNPYGLGLAHYLYWPVLFKKANVKFWLVGNEKAATSVPHGSFDPRSPTVERDKQQLLAALVGIKNAAATVTPLGTTIELLKGESGSADYKTLCTYMDEAIALVTLGQVMTSQAVGGQYKAEVQNEVKQDIIKADADLLCASFNASIATWLTEWNFPGAHPPKLWLRTEEVKDTATIAATYAKLAVLGYRPTLETIEETFGGKWETMQPVASSQAGESATDFAEGDDEAPDTADHLADRLAREIAPHGQAWLEQIAAELAASETLLQFRERLDALAPQLSLDDYAAVLARASTVAHLAGRAEVQDEGRAP